MLCKKAISQRCWPLAYTGRDCNCLFFTVIQHCASVFMRARHGPKGKMKNDKTLSISRPCGIFKSPCKQALKTFFGSWRGGTIERPIRILTVCLATPFAKIYISTFWQKGVIARDTLCLMSGQCLAVGVTATDNL